MAGTFAYRQARRSPLDPVTMISMLLVAVSAGWAGSHLTYALVNFGELRLFLAIIRKIPSFSVLIQYLQYLFGGAVFYGGLIIGILAGMAYGKRKQLDLDAYSDIGAAAIPLFHGFGRIGCFLGGCCYGVECKIGFIYTRSVVEEAHGVRRFPIQLVESFLNFALFFFLWWLLRKSRFKGKLLYLYLCLYALIRFILEFWRGDEARGFLLGMSTSQFIGIFVFAFGLLMIIFKGRRQTDSL